MHEIGEKSFKIRHKLITMKRVCERRECRKINVVVEESGKEREKE